MLAQRRRRWANIKPALDLSLMCAGQRYTTTQQTLKQCWYNVEQLQTVAQQYTNVWPTSGQILEDPGGSHGYRGDAPDGVSRVCGGGGGTCDVSLIKVTG